MKRRLIGLKLVLKPSKCRKCAKLVEGSAEHSFCCKKIGRNTVHNKVNVAASIELSRILKNSSCTVAREQSCQTYLKEHNQVERPRSDNTITDHLAGKVVHMDFTFPSIDETATEFEPTSDKAEARKELFWDNKFLLPEGISLFPGAIDSYSRWGKKLIEWANIFSRIGALTPWDYPKRLYQLKATIATAHANAIGNQTADFLMNDLVSL